jgi:hypothetical protein
MPMTGTLGGTLRHYLPLKRPANPALADNLPYYGTCKLQLPQGHYWQPATTGRWQPST